MLPWRTIKKGTSNWTRAQIPHALFSICGLQKCRIGWHDFNQNGQWSILQISDTMSSKQINTTSMNMAV